MIILFPNERIARPDDVREHVRVYQPDRSMPPEAEDIPTLTPLGTGPAGHRPIRLPPLLEHPAPVAEGNGCAVGPGSPTAP